MSKNTSRKIMVSLIVLFAVLFLGIISVLSTANILTFKGYVSDTACGLRGEDTEGHDLTVCPQRYAVDNLKENSNSGYGIFIPYKNDSYRFLKFDNKGSAIVKLILEVTKKKRGIIVEAKGILANNMIIVSGMREITSMK